MNTPQPVVSIVITTRNRADDLRTALQSCRKQVGVEFEILVYDDASTDQTRAIVEEEFPDVRYFPQHERTGYIILRNRGYHDARGKFVVSIDDDAYFTSESTVCRLVEQMIDIPDVAALAIPYYERYPVGRRVSSKPPGPGLDVKSYVGTAHICRVSAVVSVGLYHEFLVHQGEERDLCVRLLQAGWRICTADSPPLVHNVSANRDLDRMHRWGTRNTILFDFFYTPLLLLVPVLARRYWQMLRYRFSIRRAASTLKWLLLALPDCVRFRGYRRPFPLSGYRRYLALPSHGPVYVRDSELPAPCQHTGNEHYTARG